MAIAAGYEDADDLDALRRDQALMMACDRAPDSGVDLPSQPTISRLENLADTHALYRIGIGFIDRFLDSPPSTRPPPRAQRSRSHGRRSGGWPGADTRPGVGWGGGGAVGVQMR